MNLAGPRGSGSGAEARVTLPLHNISLQLVAAHRAYDLDAHARCDGDVRKLPGLDHALLHRDGYAGHAQPDLREQVGHGVAPGTSRLTIHDTGQRRQRFPSRS